MYNDYDKRGDMIRGRGRKTEDYDRKEEDRSQKSDQGEREGENKGTGSRGDEGEVMPTRRKQGR